MNNENESQNDIKATLQDINNAIQPEDSWEALRQRIDNQIEGSNGFSGQVVNISLVFWRRTAFALAACLVLATAILFYVIQKPLQNNHLKQGLLTQGQVEQLGAAFSNIRKLFGSDTPWMVVDSSGKGEIGVDIPAADGDSEKVIVLRLAVNTPDKQQYYDVVALANQRISFNLTQVDCPDMNVSIRPEIRSGKITIAINVRLDDTEQANDTITIADNRFTSLVQMASDNKLVTIDATGQLASSI